MHPREYPGIHPNRCSKGAQTPENRHHTHTHTHKQSIRKKKYSRGVDCGGNKEGEEDKILGASCMCYH